MKTYFYCVSIKIFSFFEETLLHSRQQLTQPEFFSISFFSPVQAGQSMNLEGPHIDAHPPKRTRLGVEALSQTLLERLPTQQNTNGDQALDVSGYVFPIQAVTSQRDTEPGS